MVKKPHKLDADCCWVSVVGVVDGTGRPDQERAWCTEAMGWGRHTVEAIAADCAQAWYRETDQSGDCSVTLRIEGPRGQVHVMNCDLSWHLLAAAIEVVQAQRVQRKEVRDAP